MDTERSAIINIGGEEYTNCSSLPRLPRKSQDATAVLRTLAIS
jgi:hypothetical protein